MRIRKKIQVSSQLWIKFKSREISWLEWESNQKSTIEVSFFCKATIERPIKLQLEEGENSTSLYETFKQILKQLKQ